jgi:hypothetical protein
LEKQWKKKLDNYCKQMTIAERSAMKIGICHLATLLPAGLGRPPARTGGDRGGRIARVAPHERAYIATHCKQMTNPWHSHRRYYITVMLCIFYKRLRGAAPSRCG